MFREMRGLEYALEILRAIQSTDRHNSQQIFEQIQRGGRIVPSLTYIQKILPRLTKANILKSTIGGYVLTRPLKEITVTMLLDVCDMPEPTSPLYSFCKKLKDLTSSISITEFYDFSYAEPGATEPASAAPTTQDLPAG